LSNLGISYSVKYRSYGDSFVLSEAEIGLLEEYLNLSRSGFDDDAIKEMPGKATYIAALAVFRKLNIETARLIRGGQDGSQDC
jgi:hypothetical protein